MFCTNCGKELETGDLFCVHCGARQEPAAGNEGPAVEKVAQADPAGVVTPANGSAVAQEITTMSLFNGWKSLSGISGLILGLHFVLSGRTVLLGVQYLLIDIIELHTPAFFFYYINVFFRLITRIYGLYLILRPVLPRHISLRAMETLLPILYVFLLSFNVWCSWIFAFEGAIEFYVDILIYSISILLLCLCYFKNRKVGICCALLLIVASCVIALVIASS